MRPSRRALTVLAVAAALVPTGPSVAAREASARYVAGGDAVAEGTVAWATGTRTGVVCGASGTTGVGGACFAVPPRVKRVSLTIHDLSTRSVSGLVSFRTADGTRVGRAAARFCGTTALRVPRGATQLVVALEQTVLPCATNPGPPTAGTVVAGFR